MRTIKFRGKRKDNNEWIQGDLAYMFGEIPYIMPINDFATALWSNEPIDNREALLGGFIEVIPETIGQFTGLFDKNGVEVFEGDIVKDDHRRTMKIGEWRHRPCFIAISETNFYHADFFQWLIGDTNVLEIEIIGNIHDNPELLEK